MGGQVPGAAALGRSDPDVAGVDERHLVALNVGESQQLGAVGLG
jgi:hypothetical protein